MAKQTKTKKSSKFSFRLLFPFALLVGGWWLWQSESMVNWKDRALQYVDNREITTLESRFLPEDIIERHQRVLLEDRRTLRQTTLKYYPYLLLDVKYTEGQKTHEGFLLWGLHDGEMVLNADTWDTTHGFRDCLECQANNQDFKILQALARRQGSLSLEDLQKEMKIEREAIETWVQRAKQKHLVVQKGQLIQLHFENPKILVTPQTRMQQPFVVKALGEGQKAAKNYTRSQIMGIAQAAFGSDFKIRKEQEVFLPVYSIDVLNPDGSIQTSEWNSLTGQQIIPRYFSKV
jgi:hypothetical protein